MRKLLSAALALCLALSLCVPAFAAGNSLDNFRKTASYSNQFKDVAANHWSAPSVKTCYEYGLMQGTAKGFHPNGTLTVAETLVMADRVHEIYTTGASTLQNGTPWYQPYVDYALAQGIIQSGDFTDYTKAATRAEMAYIFCHALPESALPAINNVTALPDVDASTIHSAEIFTLYNAGVLTGSDIYGSCKPGTTITRAEAAAIIARVAIAPQRQSVMPLKAFQVTKEITSPMPQDTETLTESGVISLSSATMNAVLSSDTNEIYRGTSITVLSTKEVNDLLVSRCQANGLTLRNAATKAVAFGAIKTYRTTGTLQIESNDCGSVIYTYITGNTFVILILFNIDNNTALLHSVANNVSISGSTVSAKL